MKPFKYCWKSGTWTKQTHLTTEAPWGRPSSVPAPEEGPSKGPPPP